MAVAERHTPTPPKAGEIWRLVAPAAWILARPGTTVLITKVIGHAAVGYRYTAGLRSGVSDVERFVQHFELIGLAPEAEREDAPVMPDMTDQYETERF